MTTRSLGLAAFLAIVASVSTAQAGESLFGWIYTADVHPKGTLEYEHWSFLQSRQSRGKYEFWFNREEIEYGVTDRLQVAAYFNWTSSNAFRNGIDGTTGGPGVSQLLPASFDPFSRFRNTRFDSISLEAIYQVLNPVTDPIGLAVYIEPEIGPLSKELEWKIILQKNFLDDRLIVAANIFGKHEREINLDGTVEKASPLDLTLGVSYLAFPNWYLGVEARIHNEFTGYFFNSPEHSAFFAGPVVHYATKDFWITAAWRHQLPMVQTYNAEQAALVVNHRIYGEEHARNEFMFKMGIPFGAKEGGKDEPKNASAKWLGAR